MLGWFFVHCFDDCFDWFVLFLGLFGWFYSGHDIWLYGLVFIACLVCLRLGRLVVGYFGFVSPLIDCVVFGFC